jgi:hypothetical protein
VLETAASGVARFDHNPTTFESLGLLIEEQRTNLLLYSEQFDNAAWIKLNVTLVANTAISPNGSLTAFKLIKNATTATANTRQVGASSVTGTYTASTYAKRGEWGFLYVSVTGSSTTGVAFNLDTGAATVIGSGPTGKAEPVGNGWWRCSVTQTLTAQDATNTNQPRPTADGATVTGDDYSGVFIWGAQLEARAFPTSYIPTVASQVTSSADAASMTGANFSSWYNAGEGTLYADLNSGVTSLSLDGAGFSRGAACLHDGTNNNRIRFGVNVTGATLIANNVIQADYGFAFSAAANTNYKIAFGYKVNSFNLANNNVLATEDTSGIVSVGVNQMAIGNSSTAGNGVLNGTIKKIAFYPLRLTNAQLQALTS